MNFLIVLITILSCSGNLSQMEERKKNPLAAELVEIGYPMLFMFGDRSLCDSVWNDGKAQAELEEIVKDDAVSDHAKFLAFEVLRSFNVEPEVDQYKTVAEIYAKALENTGVNAPNSYRLTGNLWGFLYELNDVGYLGERFILTGENAIKPLSALLNNARMVSYEGSKEATMGNGYFYRVKDFAAFYLSKITGLEITFYQDLDQRDQEIERFMAELEKRP